MIPETDLFATAFFLADHAVVENGKVYVNGGFWNQMHFTQFPATTTFSIVGVVNVPWLVQEQPHTFRVAFTDSDGHPVSNDFGGEFTINRPVDAEIGQPFLMPIAATANGFTFPAPGAYSAGFFVDDEELARWVFRVNARG